MILDADQIVNLLGRHSSFILQSKDLIEESVGGDRMKTTVSVVDALIMMCLILEERPSHAIEFAPYRGYSTCFIARACREVGAQFTTFEKNRSIVDGFLKKNLERFGLQDDVEIVVGDALTRVPEYIKKHGCDVGFTFIDCEHSKRFAQSYVKEIFPLLLPDSLICVHDISAKKRGQHSDFETNTKGRVGDEYKVVLEWTKKRSVDYVLTHAIFGGKFEISADLPVNNELYEKIAEAVGIDLRKFLKYPPLIMVSRNVS